MKIDGRRILVDCERGRVVRNWRPRKFGGGKGNTRRGRSLEIEKELIREKNIYKNR